MSTVKENQSNGQPNTSNGGGPSVSSTFHVKRKHVSDEINGSDVENTMNLKRIHSGKNSSTQGLFLESVNRYMLDFDFEKICSVSLANLHVYACLVCGKYYQG